MKDSNMELLSTLVGRGKAEKMMKSFGTLSTLAQADVFEIAEVGKVSLYHAERLRAGMQLGARSVLDIVADEATVTRPEDAAEAVRPLMFGLKTETLWVSVLNTRNKIVCTEMIYQGTVDSCPVRVSEIIRPAVVRNLPGVVIYHNHPSGDPSPSPEDVQLTAACVRAGKLLSINVLDHIVFGKNLDFISIKSFQPSAFN